MAARSVEGRKGDFNAENSEKTGGRGGEKNKFPFSFFEAPSASSDFLRGSALKIPHIVHYIEQCNQL
jgi:hypothetical protein